MTVLMNKKAEIKNRIDLINRGEVPEGYKKVHGYIIPNDWNIVPIKKIARQVKRSVEKPTESYYRLSVRSHAKGTFHSFVEHPETVAMEELFQVKENDLIVNITFAWEHAIAIVKKEDNNLLVSHRFPTYEFNSNASVKFYENIIKLPRIKKMLSDMSPGGAGRNRVLNQTDFYNSLYIPYTNFKEQEKIAKILNCCDKVIELKQKLLEEKNKEKKWLVKNLIQPKTILNCNDKTYKEYEFEDVIIKLPTKKYQINTTEYLTIGKYPVVDQGKNKIIAYCNNSEKLYKCPINGIIVFGDHTREIKYIDFDFVIGADGTQILSVQNGISVKYIYYYLLNQRIPNTGYNRHYKFLKNILFMIPSQEKQKHVVQILSKIDNHIEYLEQELEQYKQLKKSLSQLLLTGIVRTVEV